MAQYILLDDFNGHINVVCKDDGSGDTLILNTLSEAEQAKEEFCQDGLIIPLGFDIIKLLTHCEEIVSSSEEPDAEITIQLDDILDLK